LPTFERLFKVEIHLKRWQPFNLSKLIYIVMKKNLQLLATAVLITCLPLITIFAQAPANDDCSGAIAVTTNPFGATCTSPTAASTVNATSTVPAPSCASAAIANDDIWYIFTASSQSVIVRVTNAVQVPSGTGNISMEVYSGTCGTLTSITCANGFAFASGFRIINGLTIGNTYFIRFWTVSTTNSANFNFCVQDVPAPPVNDECTGAIAITTQPFGTTCAASIAANTSGATQSSPNPSCTSTDNNDDIWYSFTASSQSVILRFSNLIETTNGNTASLGYALYNATCPSNTTTFSCDNNIGFGSGFEIIDGLTIGNTYFLRLFGQGSNNYISFNFCVQDVPAPPANNECVNAIPITTQPFGTTCTASVAANTTGATRSTPDPSCVSTDNNDDIWYSFTANSQSVILRFSNLIETTNGTTGSLGYALYNTSCPSTTTTFSCSGNIGFGSGFRIIDGLTIGNTYFLRLFGQGFNNYISFNFCVQDVPAPPANNECVNAIPIITQPFGTTCTASVTANTTGATQSLPNPSCTSTDNNDDIWYSFTASSQSIIIRFSNLIETTNGTLGSLGAALYNAACPSSTTTFSCNTTIGFSSGFKIIDGLTIGNTYFLRLFGQGSNNYISFNFCVQDVPAPPANNECVNAIPITTQPFGTTCTASVTANTSGATQSSPNPSCTSTDNNDDIWYSFTANSQSVILRFSNLIQTTNGNTASLGYALYNASCPSATTTFSCSGNIGFGNDLKIIDGLSIGNTYFLRLFGQGSNNYVSFNFCIQDVPAPPANDECANAISVALSLPGSSCISSISVNTTGATLSANSPSCASSNNDDVWYSFTASTATAILRYSNCVETTAGGSASIGFALYTSCPAGTTSLQCSNSFGFGSGFVNLTSLTPGNTYLLRLFSAGTNNYASFNFCLQSPLVNDECVNAINLPVTNGFCNTPVIASLNGATTSAGFTSPTCKPGGASRDVWFKTTVPATGNVIIQTSAVKTAANDLVMTAYTGVCGTLTQIACDDDGNPETFPSANHSRISLTGRTAGELITLRVTAVFSSNEEQFAICAWDETGSVLPPIAAGGNCITGNARIIDSAQGNIYMWVPIFDNGGNIIAEIYSDGNNLGNITPDVFVNTSGTVRSLNNKFYLDRNIGLAAVNSASAKIRFYIKNSEFTALQAVDPSIISANDLKILKTSTACQSALSSTNTAINQNANTPYGSDLYLQFITPSLSSFYIDGLGGTVPVYISAYNAVCNKNNVIISWVTATEINNKFFTVEKSEDGVHFKALAIVNGAINSGTQKQYAVTDFHPFISKTYYRLKQTDLNGREQYFNILTADCSSNTQEVVIYPNPVSNELFVKMNSSFKKGKLKILSGTGALINEIGYITQRGNVIAINVQSLSPGVYFLQITNEKEERNILKFVKQ
jgi:hypothetical protein